LARLGCAARLLSQLAGVFEGSGFASLGLGAPSWHDPDSTKLGTHLRTNPTVSSVQLFDVTTKPIEHNAPAWPDLAWLGRAWPWGLALKNNAFSTSWAGAFELWDWDLARPGCTVRLVSLLVGSFEGLGFAGLGPGVLRGIIPTRQSLAHTEEQTLQSVQFNCST
jgi:hypothetical protein